MYESINDAINVAFNGTINVTHDGIQISYTMIHIVASDVYSDKWRCSVVGDHYG